MKTGISTACFFKRLYNEDALRQIGEIGAKEVEMFFSANMEYEEDFLKGLKETCEKYDMRIRSVHALSTQFEPQLYSYHDRQVSEGMDVFRNVLRAAAFLGAEIYVFHGPMRVKIAKKLALDMGYVGERTDVLAEEAKKFGIKFTYETVHWCWYQYPDFAGELLEHCKSDNLYFTLDMKQVAQSGYALDEYIDAMQGRLAHVRVCDYVKNPESGILPVAPFRGQTDWQGIRQKLADIGYDGLAMLEIYADNYENYEELRRIYEEVRQFFA